MKVYFRELIAIITFVGLFNLANGQMASQKFEKVQELEGVEEYKYTPNGMNLLLLQDNSAPVVTVQIVYRVGSKHEVPGNTGSTHLLEHLNFKGTPTFNKKDGTAIFKVLQAIGAQMNATTWNDRTNYFETIPSDKIELALQIEADRMRNSLLLKEDKEAEMTVVRNEFERGENNPNSLLSKEIWATAYKAHPYHHSTIGWRSDIENMPIEVLREFYDTYYWPNNATLTIVGDYKKEELFELVDRYFGKITKSPHDIPQPYTEEPEQYGPRKVVVKRPGQQSVLSVAYKMPGRMHDDTPALHVLGELMGSGTSSLLNRTFVDTGLATYGYAQASNFQEVGLFTIGLGISPEKDIEEVNAQVLELVESVKTEGVQQSDVDRVIAKLTAQELLYRDGSGSISGELAEAIAGGDWTDYIKGSERLGRVTAADVKRVANTYLLVDQSTTGYFIPKMDNGGSEKTAAASPSNIHAAQEGMYYFRNPSDRENDEMGRMDNVNFLNSLKPNGLDSWEKEASTANDQFVRKEVAGIDVVSVQTAAKGFVNVAASLPFTSYFGPEMNSQLPSLTTQLLSKGTKKQDKFAFSQALEQLGSNINITASGQHININFKCLTGDVATVLGLLAEELREPLFDAKELELLKEQNINGLKRGLTDPGTQANIAFSQALYEEGHPNYTKSIEASIKEIESITVEKIKNFHDNYFGTAGMKMVVVGQVDTKSLYKALNQNFRNWDGGDAVQQIDFQNAKANSSFSKVVTIPEKPSAEMRIGLYTGIEREDDDYIPFYLGASILGGGFSDRLMQTVRDDEGLTYGIYSGHSGHYGTGGNWFVMASFNPELFQKGLESSMRQINNWVQHGITQAELDTKKASIIGSFKVGMATTSGLSNTLLSFLERGLSPDYMEKYPQEIQAVTLEQVNKSIKKYIDPEKIVIIKAGALDQQGNPL